MSYIRDFEGAGRVRLSNRARMSYTAFREAMKEKLELQGHSVTPERSREESEDRDELRDELEKAVSRIARLEKERYLQKAMKDRATGRTRTETEPSITHYSSERDLWK